MRYLIAVILFICIGSPTYAFKTGEQYVCQFDRILRYKDGDTYFTKSYSNQSPFSFTINQENIVMSENWFVDASLEIMRKDRRVLIAFNNADIIKIFKEDNGKILGYAGTLDSYIKMFYVSCSKL